MYANEQINKMNFEGNTVMKSMYQIKLNFMKYFKWSLPKVLYLT